ncbi:RNA polymerase subunit sigma-24, partial [Streptomyces sp. NPDC059083]
LDQAARLGRGLGAYGLQAAIAECHAVADSVEATDWSRVVLLYEALARLSPSPIIDLNRAVAVSMAEGPAPALGIVDDLRSAAALPSSHLLPSVRGELLARLGRTAEARTEFDLAITLCDNDQERAVLEAKLAELD